jgi:hypothetical protein
VSAPAATTLVAGLQLQFRIGSSDPWTSAAALTDSSGKASASLTAPATVGAFPFTVMFAADADYNAGSASGPLTIAP